MGRVDLTSAAFAAFAALTVGSAGVVAFARSVMNSVAGLLGALVGVAGLYVLLSADLLAAVQLLVSVGGTLVLILLAVMLTARADATTTSNDPLPRGRPVRTALLLFAMLSVVAVRTTWPTVRTTSDAPSAAKLGHALLGAYVVPFELASVALVVALVGALVVARRAVKAPRTEEPLAP